MRRVAAVTALLAALILSGCTVPPEQAPTTPEPAPAAQKPPAPMISAPDWVDPFDGSVALAPEVSAEVLAESNFAGMWGPSTRPNPYGAELSTETSSAVCTLGMVDEYRGYDPAVLDAKQGSFEFYFKPDPKTSEILRMENRLEWERYGSYDPPSYGFMLDTVGWRAAPTGSYALTSEITETTTTVNWGVWDGAKWNNATYIADTPWDADTWRLVTVSYGPAGLRLFVDGEQVAENTEYTGGIDTKQTFFLGQAPWYWPYGPHSMPGQYQRLAYSRTQQ